MFENTEHVCYICFDSEGELFKPCNNNLCTGRAHQECLKLYHDSSIFTPKCGNCRNVIIINNQLSITHENALAMSFAVGPAILLSTSIITFIDLIIKTIYHYLIAIICRIFTTKSIHEPLSMTEICIFLIVILPFTCFMTINIYKLLWFKDYKYGVKV